MANKYLEKIAGKLSPEYKNEVRKNLDQYNEIAGAMKSDTVAVDRMKHLAGDVQHSLGRELQGHKLGKTYGKPVTNSLKNDMREGYKKTMQKLSPSKAKEFARSIAIAGRIIRRK